MKASILAIAGLCAAAGVVEAQERKEPKPQPWRGFNQGVKWESSLEEALARAVREKKPLLLYQLVGDLSREGC